MKLEIILILVVLLLAIGFFIYKKEKRKRIIATIFTLCGKKFILIFLKMDENFKSRFYRGI